MGICFLLGWGHVRWGAGVCLLQGLFYANDSMCPELLVWE